MTTSLSLLERLRADPQAAAWKNLVEIYTPLIQNSAAIRSRGDSDDIAQEVLEWTGPYMTINFAPA